MGSNSKSFKSDLNKIEKAINKEITASAQNLVEQIFLGLKEVPPIGTPVLTGWARAGWRVSLNSPTAGEVGLTGNPGPAETKSKRSLKAFLSRKTLSKVSSIFIDNRVPYISLLNEGTSTKSPPAFIEMAIQRGIALTRKKRRAR